MASNREALSYGAIDPDLRQRRLSSFGRVLAIVALGYVGMNTLVALWLGRPSFNLNSLPLGVAGLAFASLWLLLRRPSRSPRFVRWVELSTLFIGTVALSTLAMVMDLTASPDMMVRSVLSYVLLVYAVYVPATARQTLRLAACMTVPLLGCIFIAFRSWDPALHDPPAALWRKADVGDMATPATLVSAFLWAVVVGIAAGFSHKTFGLRSEVREFRRLGQYTLEAKLGEGGMGVVYRATHAMLRRPTAIKLMAQTRNPQAIARFEREVQRTAMLTHPNTVTVFDYGRTNDGVFYYAMELLEGASLEELVQLDGPLPAGRVIHLLQQVAASLTEAHDAGLIHRDIKPSNILVLERGGISDLIKVVDFGLVKELAATDGAAGSPELSVPGLITGTPQYIAPESLTAPESVDARVDLYALGAVGYWLLTGTHVFAGTSALELCVHHLHSSPELPSKRLGQPIEPELQRLIMDCLAKNPVQRPRTARAFRERLQACAAVNPWTPQQAAAWWATHGHRVPSRRSQEITSQSPIEIGAAELALRATCQDARTQRSVVFPEVRQEPVALAGSFQSHYPVSN